MMSLGLASCAAAFLQVAAAVPVQVNLVIDFALLLTGLAMIWGGAHKAGKLEQLLSTQIERSTELTTKINALQVKVTERNEHIIRIETNLTEIRSSQDRMSGRLENLSVESAARDGRLAKTEANVEAVAEQIKVLRHDMEEKAHQQDAEINALREWRHGLAGEAQQRIFAQELARRHEVRGEGVEP